MTSHFSPVSSTHAFSMAAISALRCAPASASLAPAFTAPSTRLVMSSYDTRMFTSRSGHSNSSARVGA